MLLVGYINDHNVVYPIIRNACAQNVADQLPVWIYYPNTLAAGDVLMNQVVHERAFADPGSADNVHVSGSILRVEVDSMLFSANGVGADHNPLCIRK